MPPVLSKVSDVMNAQVEAGEITGAVTAVAVNGKVVHFDAHGWRDLEDRTPMPLDAIFRMASSTKPVVGVAVMQQIERGVLDPDEPVNSYIPEFKDTMVAVPKPGTPTAARYDQTGQPIDAGGEGVTLGAAAGGFGRAERPPADEVELVPARRDLLVRDLLTHTSGLLSGGLGSAVSTVRRERDDTLATYIPRLGTVALDFQPGTRWRYSPGTGIDVLGHIVELVSGQSLDVYLAEHIFEPIGMKDTFFALPPDRAERLLPLYRKTEEGFVKADPSMAGRMSSATYFSGSGGLMSTAADYLQFERMLTAGGTLDGVQVLRPETVALMATNHVGDLFGGLREPVQGVGFGYTVQVILDAERARSRRANGAFGWGGAFGTMTWSDPGRGVSGVFMVQQPNLLVRARFERAVYAAVGELAVA